MKTLTPKKIAKTGLMGLSLLCFACQFSPTINASSGPTQKSSALTQSSINLSGHILLPSGVKQEPQGLLMPSGLLAPSGVLIPTGLRSANTLQPFQILNTQSTAPRFSGLPFRLEVFDLKGKKLLSTQSNEKGAYFLSKLPPNQIVRLEAKALALPQLRFLAFAHTPASPKDKLIRNLDARSTSAVYLANAPRIQQKEIPLINFQNHPQIAPLLDKLAPELEANLGAQDIDEIRDFFENEEALYEEFEDIAENHPELYEELEDALEDEDHFEDHDFEDWEYETQEHESDEHEHNEHESDEHEHNEHESDAHEDDEHESDAHEDDE